MNKEKENGEGSSKMGTSEPRKNSGNKKKADDFFNNVSISGVQVTHKENNLDSRDYEYCTTCVVQNSRQLGKWKKI